jgi:hypothetical protein
LKKPHISITETNLQEEPAKSPLPIANFDTDKNLLLWGEQTYSSYSIFVAGCARLFGRSGSGWQQHVQGGQTCPLFEEIEGLESGSAPAFGLVRLASLFI